MKFNDAILHDDLNKCKAYEIECRSCNMCASHSRPSRCLGRSCGMHLMAAVGWFLADGFDTVSATERSVRHYSRTLIHQIVWGDFINSQLPLLLVAERHHRTHKSNAGDISYRLLNSCSGHNLAMKL